MLSLQNQKLSVLAGREFEEFLVLGCGFVWKFFIVHKLTFIIYRMDLYKLNKSINSSSSNFYIQLFHTVDGSIGDTYEVHYIAIIRTKRAVKGNIVDR